MLKKCFKTALHGIFVETFWSWRRSIIKSFEGFGQHLKPPILNRPAVNFTVTVHRVKSVQIAFLNSLAQNLHLSDFPDHEVV